VAAHRRLPRRQGGKGGRRRGGVGPRHCGRPLLRLLLLVRLLRLQLMVRLLRVLHLLVQVLLLQLHDHQVSLELLPLLLLGLVLPVLRHSCRRGGAVLLDVPVCLHAILLLLVLLLLIVLVIAPAAAALLLPLLLGIALPLLVLRLAPLMLLYGCIPRLLLLLLLLPLLLLLLVLLLLLPLLLLLHVLLQEGCGVGGRGARRRLLGRRSICSVVCGCLGRLQAAV
jgi:hypothetical protein